KGTAAPGSAPAERQQLRCAGDEEGIRQSDGIMPREELVVSSERSKPAFQTRNSTFPSSESTFQGSPGVIQKDRKSTRLNSSHGSISYAVFCLKKKKRAASNTDR